MKKQGPKTSGWKLRAATSGLALLIVVADLAGKCPSLSQISEDANEQLRLTVLVYIYARISEHDLARAKHVASRILQEAGVELAWVDCALSRPRAQLNPACAAPHAPTDIHLNIMPDLAEGPRVGGLAMGLAVATSPPNRGQFASISYARARKQLLEAPELTPGQLLGHGIAHEIGHLLLGTDSHSPTGLMSARWSSQELKLAAYSKLTFSDEQAAGICGDVRARMKAQKAQKSATAAMK